MAVVPLPRKRFRFSVEEAHDDGSRMAIGSVELDRKEARRLLEYLVGLVE